MTQDKLKIFISYSRKDCAAFAEDLVAGLELLGFDPFLDLHDIAAGEDWEDRLGGLIQSVDTMVYALSPASVKSEICAWEVDQALKLGKRLIPIIALPVDDNDVPEPLKRLNYIFFDKPHSNAKALSQLSQALKTDLNWIREHTRLSELANRWKIREKLDAQLLRGPELEAATNWMAGWKAGAPDVPDSVQNFIQSSSDAQTSRANKQRQQLETMAKAQAAQAKALAEQEVAVGKLSRRTTMGLITAGVLTTAAGGLAWWGTDAERRFRAAQKEAEEIKKKSIEATIRKEAMRTDIVGQINAFAAAPGEPVGSGTDGGNSPYTKQMLNELLNPDISLISACSHANQIVTIASSIDQRPYLSTDMNGDIYLQRQPESRRRFAIIVSEDKLVNEGEIINVERDTLAWERFLNEKCGFDVQRLKNPKKWTSTKPSIKHGSQAFGQRETYKQKARAIATHCWFLCMLEQVFKTMAQTTS